MLIISAGVYVRPMKPAGKEKLLKQVLWEGKLVLLAKITYLSMQFTYRNIPYILAYKPISHSRPPNLAL